MASMRPLRRRLDTATAPLAALLLLPAAPLAAHTPITARFTFLRDVLPIVERRCGSCHRSGGIGPMSLVSYAEARPWAAAIRAEVLAGRMPPWPVEEAMRFAGERVLTAREIDVFADWASGGAPEGRSEPKAPPPSTDPSPASPPVAAPNGAGPGGETQELILSMPSAYVLESGVAEARHEVRRRPALAGERWIAALELRAGNPAILRGALVWLETGSAPRELLLSWTPAQAPVSYPAGAGRRLPAGADLLLSLDYRRGFQQRGEERPDRSALVLTFLAAPPATVVRPALLGGSLRLPAPARLLSLTALLPPGAPSGSGLAVEAHLPGGPARLILSGRNFHPRWPIALRPAEPPELPAGTMLESRAAQTGRPPAAGELWIETAGPDR